MSSTARWVPSSKYINLQCVIFYQSFTLKSLTSGNKRMPRILTITHNLVVRSLGLMGQPQSAVLQHTCIMGRSDRLPLWLWLIYLIHHFSIALLVVSAISYIFFIFGDIFYCKFWFLIIWLQTWNSGILNIFVLYSWLKVSIVFYWVNI